MQRDQRVGAVQRLAASMRLDVEHSPGLDERAEVGDRVVHDVAVTVALDVQRLVEVLRARPGRSSRTGCRSGPGRAAAGARPPRPRPDLGREVDVDLELPLDRGDPLAQLVDPASPRTRSTRSLTSRAPYAPYGPAARP